MAQTLTQGRTRRGMIDATTSRGLGGRRATKPVWVALVLALVAQFGCADTTPGSAANPDTRADAVTPDTPDNLAPDSPPDAIADSTALDTLFDTTADTITPDTPDTPDPTLVLGRRYALTLAAGTVEGELIATYDQRGWWTPGDDILLALFDPSAFPERPEDWASDRSIRIVARADVTAIAPLPDLAPTFAEFARARHLWPAVPLPGPTYVMAGHERHHLAEDGFGDFAYDLGRADESGRWRDDGLDLADYLSWDAPVLAPRGGLVVEAIDDHPDRPIILGAPDPADFLALPENLVGLWLTGRYYLYLLHLQEGSLPPDLAPGDVIPPGTPLGRVGNSGTSREPHLHLALLFWDSERERSFSVPLAFTDVYTSARPTGASPAAELTPLGGVWIANTPF